MITALTDRLDALDLLLQAHIAATEKLVPGTAQKTANMADSFVKQLADEGRPMAAKHLQGLADMIRVVGGFGVNDGEP